MNKLALLSFALAFLQLPAPAQLAANPLEKLAGLQAEALSAPLSPDERNKVYSALAGLPADTDSFVVVNRLGELAALALEVESPVPWAEMASELDGAALGITRRAVEDLQRLQPLFQLLSVAETDIADTWVAKAQDDAARAIVAVQREQQVADGASLVQATKDFHLAPIYMVLTARPGGEGLMQQLSMLPLMMPLGSDAPIQMTVRSGWRGFCVQGNMLDLSETGLAPEHESQIKANLQNARLYVLARAVGRRLVLVLCSNPDEVQLPAHPADSLLAAPVMDAYDSGVMRRAWAAGYGSPAVVQLRAEMDLFSYRYVASFMEKVFLRLAPQSNACAKAATAVKSLLEMAEKFIPAQQGAERMMLWEDESLYLHIVCAAGPHRFVEAPMRHTAQAEKPETVLFAESAPVTGGPEVNVSAVLDNVTLVQQGYLDTLKPEYGDSVLESCRQLKQNRGKLEQLAAGFFGWHSGQTGSTALVVSRNASAAPFVSFALRSEMADAATAARTCEQLNECGAALCPEMHGCFSMRAEDSALLLNAGVPAAELPAAEPGPMMAGAWFTLKVPTLADVLETAAGSCHDPQVKDAAEAVRNAAQYVQQIDAAASTRGEELHTLIRLTPTE